MEEQPYNAFDEWQLQAEYDLETAKCLLESGRLVYVGYFCHLSLNRALMANRNILNGKKVKSFISYLNTSSSLYPENLSAAMKEFSLEKTKNILAQTKQIIQWLKQI